MTTTSPGLISRVWMAAKQASSPSKTCAGPVMRVVFSPATLATAPSGARLPCRITRCPVRVQRLVERPDHVLLAVDRCSPRPCRFSASVSPGHGEAVAVQQAGVEQRLEHRRRAADAVQVVHDVAAARLEVGQVRHLAAEPVEVGQRPRAPPASRAMAIRCSTALVEPPRASTSV